MRPAVAAVLFAAAPLAAQQPVPADTVRVRIVSHPPRIDTLYSSAAKRDTAAIRAAVRNPDLELRRRFDRKPGEQVTGVRIVADTAWVKMYDPLHDMIDIPSDGRSTAGTAVRMREVRVERRAGKWVRMTPPRDANPRLRD